MATVTGGGDREQLEGSLRRAHEELHSTLGELESAMGASLDWRAWVRRRPWPSLLLVALIGLRLGRGRWL